MRFSLSSSGLFALTAGALVAVVSPAFAQEACGESTCPKGYVCETFSGGCPAIDCAEGSACEPCTPAEVSSCVPGACTTDADCAEGMGCAAIEEMSCPEVAPTCDPAGECSEPIAPVDCTPTVAHECRPRWQLPCTVASDCGAGFTCEAQESCSCSGSDGSEPAAGSGTPGSGAAGASSSSGAAGAGSADPLPPECECHPTGAMACLAIETPCATDGDCAAGWSCQDNPDGVCWSDAAGNTGCTPADPPRLCVAPYSDLGGGGYAEGEGTAAPGTDDNDGTSTGAPRDPSAESGEEPAADEPAASGGCAVSGAPGTSAGAGLWLLGLAAVLGLRRRRGAR